MNRALLALSPLVLLLAIGCSQSEPTAPSGAGTETAGDAQKPTNDLSIPTVRYEYDLSIPTVRYEYDLSAGNPSISAADGGPGFTGDGWETNTEFLAIGSADAVKGGSLSQAITDWPATLRMGGQNWNSSLNYLVRDLCFPALVGQHPVTLEFIPGLATHWQISDDKMTYRFRLNPAAKWSDGTSVTVDDYLESHRLWMDESILFPSNQIVFGKFTPVKVSDYILEIRCSQENWRNFLYASGMVILCREDIGGMSGTEFLDRFQFSYPRFCGPYKVEPDDVVMNQSVTLTRNPEYWDANNPAWVGMNNIDKLRFEVVKEDVLVYEKTKAGELDYYVISKAKWFANDLPEEEVCKKGHIVRMKVFNDAPIGTSGLAMNMQREPFTDVRIRKAMSHLFNRELMIDKLFYDEYAPLNSYWQGATYGNENNPMVAYDEFAAQELLSEAGWSERNGDGYLEKDGAVLEFDLMYRSKGSETFLTIIQESMKKLGVKCNLKILTPSTFWKNLQEKQYDAAMMNWGALVTPNPETSWKSTLADQPNNNNVTAFKDARVDELLKLYDEEYDVQRRRQLIKEMDGIIFAAHPYALGWYKPAQRFICANKFSWPKWGTSRVYEDSQEMVYLMWVDPAKEARLAEARQDSSITLPVPPLENHFWPAWNAQQAQLESN